jgi:methionine-rich copper-binding protein CopC
MSNKLVAGVTLATILLVALSATSVLGHAELVSSDPEDGSVVSPSIGTIVATYDEELTPNGSSIVVQNESGAQVAAGTVSTSDDKQMSVDVPHLDDGAYSVLWTAVTADDQGVTRGTFHFSVGAPPSAGATTAAPTPAASATPGSNTGRGNDLLLPLGAVVVIVVVIAGYLLYRNRRPGQPA